MEACCRMTLLLFVLCFATGVLCHPERPAIPDNAVARQIFQTAEANRTKDGFLSTLEMEDIFSKFDLNTDGVISEPEFISHWQAMQLGDLTSAMTLFHRADTDKDGSISRVPDFARLFYYFDRDGDGKISEQEFVLVWYSLSA